MIKATFEQLQQNFDEYVTATLNGNEIIIVKDDVEIGTFTPSVNVLRDRLQQSLVSGEYGKNIKRRRKLGIGKTKVKLSADFDKSFNALDRDIEKLFGA
ncbi:MAG: hypothetical protein IJ668_09005 [Selenomonadaceae bacterium]|nr:hypothetical protein [Selenomonadaceae bacterium]